MEVTAGRSAQRAVDTGVGRLAVEVVVPEQRSIERWKRADDPRVLQGHWGERWPPAAAAAAAATLSETIRACQLTLSLTPHVVMPTHLLTARHALVTVL